MPLVCHWNQTQWNPVEIADMALPPCHTLFQFYVSEGRLSCQLYQRSADLFLGVPYNIASYALLTMLIASITGLNPGEFVHTFGDAHIYENHIEQIDLQLGRKPMKSPIVWIDPRVRNIEDFTEDHVNLMFYSHHPALRGEVAV
jgi:thymidylate synthase